MLRWPLCPLNKLLIGLGLQWCSFLNFCLDVYCYVLYTLNNLFLILVVIIFLITAGVEELNSTCILGLLQVCFRHVINVFITSTLTSLAIRAIWLALSSVIYSQIASFFALNRICSKSRHSCSKLHHFCFKSHHFCSISHYFCFKYKMICDPPSEKGS